MLCRADRYGSSAGTYTALDEVIEPSFVKLSVPAINPISGCASVAGTSRWWHTPQQGRYLWTRLFGNGGYYQRRITCSFLVPPPHHTEIFRNSQTTSTPHEPAPVGLPVRIRMCFWILSVSIFAGTRSHRLLPTGFELITVIHIPCVDHPRIRSLPSLVRFTQTPPQIPNNPLYAFSIYCWQFPTNTVLQPNRHHHLK